MASPSIRWPAIGFQVHEGPRFEQIASYPDGRAFGTSRAYALAEERRLGMTLVDSAGGSWRVDAVRKLGLAGPWWELLLGVLFVGQYAWRVEHELTKLGPMTLDEVKRRVNAAIDASPEHWIDEEAAAGEAGPPVDEKVQLETLKARVGAAADLAAIIEALERPEPG